MPSQATRIVLARHHRVIKARRASAAASRGRWLTTFVAVMALLLSLMIVAGVATATAASAASVFAWRYFTRDLPSVSAVGSMQLPETTMIYDRNGVLLYEAVDPKEGKRTSIPLSEMPINLIKATIGVEDPTFFDNPGIDVRSIGRALLSNYQAGRVTQGASTITQQLVKNSLLDPEVSYTRKIREAILAYRLTRTYTKEQLLELYLNQNNYGNHAYGVEAAAEAYFGKKAQDLDLAECAMLAGLPQAPSVYNPEVNPTAAKQRQREVLDAMVAHGFLDQASADAAYAEPLDIRPTQTVLRAPHFVFYVLDELVKRFGHDAVYKGGLRVRTTLDYGLQQQAERIAQRQVAAVASHHVSNASVVAINPKTGEIVTMLGSIDYNNDAIDGKFNVATGLRQPGSSIKPITYATAFERGWSPATVLVDSKSEFPITQEMWSGQYVPRPGAQKPYAPANYDEKFHGPLPIRMTLGNSLNIPAVKTLMFTGVPAMMDTAKRMGITTFDRDPSSYGLSLTLGSGEVRLLDLTSAYTVFADGGVRHPPVAWLEVTDHRGRVLDEFHLDKGEQVLSPQVAFLITSVLSDDKARELEFGTNSGLQLSRPAAAKTGTTDSFRDNWTVGYTPNLAVGVWVGNSNNDKMIDIIGITGAGPIWHDLMEDALKPLPVEDFTVPPGLVRERVSDLTGLLPAVSEGQRYRYTIGPDGQRHYEYETTGTSQSGEPTHDDWFIEGTEPTRRTYRTGTYRAYWGTGQIAAGDCPSYLVDERVWGPEPPPPGVFDCVRGTSSYDPSAPSRTAFAGLANAYVYPAGLPAERPTYRTSPTQGAAAAAPTPQAADAATAETTTGASPTPAAQAATTSEGSNQTPVAAPTPASPPSATARGRAPAPTPTKKKP